MRVQGSWRGPHLAATSRCPSRLPLPSLSLPYSSSSRGVSSFLSSPALFLGDQVILFSFLSLRLALANQVDTCVRVILVMMANMIFSPLVG